MLFCFLFFSVLLWAMLRVAAAKPTHFAKIHYRKNCSALVEDDDWLITSLIEFQPKIIYISPFLAFNVRDTNVSTTPRAESVEKGLTINTTCSIVLPSSSNSTLANADLFHLCENKDMRFRYDGNTLELSRWYRDPCLGAYPYDSATAWGHAGAIFTTTNTAGGSLRTVTQMRVPDRMRKTKLRAIGSAAQTSAGES
ncbi:hypothetical protein DOTSEDRAFT_19466 [Dothistroma septosporum NZE10]|uniref:AA1-like domain-containing protein n=1 Tax=Dothistroma septosporum (strain NZE10 / CBS 128990) TaxID=675120 RepID=N1Q2U7_DOTSN|nr:hypothetical protein DOTSEDRAFT_19466 [Dothistroma septosporum NZE10]